MSKYNIIIADDNLEFSTNVCNYLKSFDLNINIISTVSNGKELLNVLYKQEVNLVILDLKMPELSGIDVLKELSGFHKTNFKVLIISGENKLLNEISIKYYNIIYKILVKPVSLRDLYTTVKEIIIEKELINNLDKKVELILSNFNFNRNSIGYEYIVKSIIRGVEDETLLQNIQLKLYNIIANEFNKTSYHIKWSIQKCISSMRKHTDSEIVNSFFPYCSNVTSKVFIKGICKYIKEDKDE